MLVYIIITAFIISIFIDKYYLGDPYDQIASLKKADDLFIVSCDSNENPSCTMWNHKDSVNKCTSLCKFENGEFTGRYKNNNFKNYNSCECKREVN